jgi:hypothetical protein
MRMTSREALNEFKASLSPDLSKDEVIELTWWEAIQFSFSWDKYDSEDNKNLDEEDEEE